MAKLEEGGGREGGNPELSLEAAVQEDGGAHAILPASTRRGAGSGFLRNGSEWALSGWPRRFQWMCGAGGAAGVRSGPGGVAGK